VSRTVASVSTPRESTTTAAAGTPLAIARVRMTSASS